MQLQAKGKIMLRKNGSIVLILILFVLFPYNISVFAAEQASDSQVYLQHISQESSNPVGELWMITNQFNLNLEQADNNANFQKYRSQFNYNFQPVLKFDLNHDWRFLTRPVIPLNYSPFAQGKTAVGYVSGLGDIEIKGLFSPISKDKNGFKWGIGPAAAFPTATDSSLGNGKWQLGGSMTALYMNDKWVVGMFPQHLWSVGGDPTRQSVSLTKTQYFIWYSPILTWQVGMAPTVLIDWNQQKAEDAVTLPVGLGVAKTVLLGKMPVKFIIEADYALVRPRQVPGNEWTFKFIICPIIPELF